MELTHLFIVAILKLYLPPNGPTVEILWNKITMYSSKIIHKWLTPNFDERELDMNCPVNASDVLMIHADE